METVSTAAEIGAVRREAEKLSRWLETEYELLRAEPFDATETRRRIGRRIYETYRKLEQLAKQEQKWLDDEDRRLAQPWTTIDESDAPNTLPRKVTRAIEVVKAP